MNIFISGAGSGIGAAVAAVFAADANKLILHAKGNSGLAKVAKTILSNHPHLEIHCLYADLSEAQERKTLIAQLKSILIQECLDILVNNAGVFLPCNCDSSDSQKILEYSWQVNVASMVEITRELLPQLCQSKSGHIFNMCSTASLQAYSTGLAYGISKYALRGFSDNLREELRAHLIKVTSVFPGATWSNSWHGHEDLREKMMQAEDVAKMIYMASKLSAQAGVEEILMRPLSGDLKL